MFTCPCGWRMPASNARAISAHRDACYREQFDPDKIIDRIADGKPPERALSAFEKATVLNRLLTMPNDKWADVFFRPFRATSASASAETPESPTPDPQ